LILGIDEAGRGPVIGPLVLCGVWLAPPAETRLREIGVQDSKAFGSTSAARQQRAGLAQQIRQHAAHLTVLVVDAAEVDRRVGCHGLNLMEQELARGLIDTGPPADCIVADGARLFGPLCNTYPNLEASNHADSTCLAVAAASIVAKVERDARFRAIVDPLERVLDQPIHGGGYANRGTETFLRAYVERFGQLPPQVRHSWSWSVLHELGVNPAAGLPLFSTPRNRAVKTT